MIRIVGTIFAGLLGLAFGSFLNVCLSRWPEGESVVTPRSHCRNCDHTLAWWENFPVLSWLLLRGRCRKCGTAIGWRYPLVEFAVGLLWATVVWLVDPTPWMVSTEWLALCSWIVGQFVFIWIAIALAVLDLEHLWLPDSLTIPGVTAGFASAILYTAAHSLTVLTFYGATSMRSRLLWGFAWRRTVGILAAAALILLIRWLYKLIRHREGIGLGDAKLMAMLAAWLGLPGALLAFVLGAVLGSFTALVLFVIPHRKQEPAAAPSESREKSWAATKLPLGTFLCIGGIISSLWGQPILNAYFRWAGF